MEMEASTSAVSEQFISTLRAIGAPVTDNVVLELSQTPRLTNVNVVLRDGQKTAVLSASITRFRSPPTYHMCLTTGREHKTISDSRDRVNHLIGRARRELRQKQK